MERTVKINPFRCRVWSEHGRLEEYLSEESCREEITSFQQHGQVVPLIGRRLIDDPTHEVEIICGARRLFVAQHLNVDVTVALRELTDRQAICVQEVENQHRKDVSPYERGRSMVRWIAAGYFESQEEIARMLNISASQVCRLIKVAKLPSVVVNAFASPLDICEAWGLELFAAWQDPERRAKLSSSARALAARNPRASKNEVFERLVSQKPAKAGHTTADHDEVVLDANGTPLFRIRYQRKSVALMFSTARIPERSMRIIKKALVALLQDEISQVDVAHEISSLISPTHQAAFESHRGHATKTVMSHESGLSM
jgi:ParB family chromosome partitioning protein